VLGLICGVAVMVLFTSCFQQDKKVILPPPGQTQYATVSMGLGYPVETYFSMANGPVDSNQFAAWDLAFESSPSGYHIWMNGGKNMYIANMNSSSFYSINGADTASANWRWDEASWNPDSTAIGNWISFTPTTSNPSYIVSGRRLDGNTAVSNGDVFIVDRGPAYSGINKFYKVDFVSVNQSSYMFKYATLDNSYIDSIILEKDPNENYTYFTFDNGGGPIVMEPGKKTWDILFTRYRYVFYYLNPPLPYLVTGVTLNLSGDMAALDSIQPYEQIDYAYVSNLTLSSERDFIGYDWKVFSLKTYTYTLHSNYTYIIKDQKGFYWKLRFIGFYNAQDQEGYPQFEYQRLGI